MFICIFNAINVLGVLHFSKHSCDFLLTILYLDRKQDLFGLLAEVLKDKLLHSSSDMVNRKYLREQLMIRHKGNFSPEHQFDPAEKKKLDTDIRETVELSFNVLDYVTNLSEISILFPDDGTPGAFFNRNVWRQVFRKSVATTENLDSVLELLVNMHEAPGAGGSDGGGSDSGEEEETDGAESTSTSAAAAPSSGWGVAASLGSGGPSAAAAPSSGRGGSRGSWAGGGASEKKKRKAVELSKDEPEDAESKARSGEEDEVSAIDTTSSSKRARLASPPASSTAKTGGRGGK